VHGTGRDMNDILQKYLNVFCIAYLKDILIYSCIREEHLSHVRKMLEFLKQAGMYAKIQKYEFLKTKSFFGCNYRKNGTRMNSKKIKII
jgi:hypothetical protein